VRNEDLYLSTTQRIVAELEQGVIPWTRPWKTTRANALGFVPTNASTGRSYSGMNILLLWGAAQDGGYPAHGWMTFKQANQIGAHVRKGEKGTTVMFTKWTEKEDDGEKKRRSILKTYTVFNLAQLDKLPPEYTREPEQIPGTTVYEEARRLITECGIRIEHGGNKAAYYPKQDFVQLPHPRAFESEEEYYGIGFHELMHATGHKNRLARDLSGRFGTKAYALEELVAELGSAFIGAHTGIPARHRCASYLKDWIAVLKEDKRAIFTAASYASQAADWIRERVHAVTDQTPDVEKAAQAA
jgi:antirestriction protein ArdC